MYPSVKRHYEQLPISSKLCKSAVRALKGCEDPRKAHGANRRLIEAPEGCSHKSEALAGHYVHPNLIIVARITFVALGA